jgi:hypothetical protein
MIDDLNKVLRELFKSRVEGLRPLPVTDQQIGFQPPDHDWRSHVVGLGTRTALNVYLVDLRENRKLRSNQRQAQFGDGIWQEDLAPHRVDCHYLISAWSPQSNHEDRTQAEHALIYDTLAVLLEYSPLNPSRVPGFAVGTIDPLIQQADLPTQVALTEGFPKLGEFWGTMGTNHRWKPAIFFVVTLPVAKRTMIAGPMVTTRITEYRHTGRPETAEVWIQIGGHVLDTTVAPATPVAHARVQLADAGGQLLQEVDSDTAGRFTFGDLRAGSYQLEARATGFNAVTRNIEVPSPTGEYDLRLT